MSQPTYKRIAVASAFSPRFEQVLAEAKRVRDRFGAELNLIYVGEQNDETNKRFSDAFTALQLPLDSQIFYHQGAPAEAILEALHSNKLELIVAGALEKEVVLRPFLGNVARRLVREAPCSVILFTKPEREPQSLKRIVFFVPEYSQHARAALQRTLDLAEKEECENLFVIRVYTTFDEARAAMSPDARTLEQEEEALEDFIEQAGESKVPTEARCIRGNTGFAASDFVQAVEANLLVVPIESTAGSNELPAHIAWVTDVIPCNLWIIR